MTIFIILLITGAIECLLGIPLILQKVPRNGVYGFRVSKTLASDNIWYPANKRCGIGLLCSGLITIIMSVLIRFNILPLNDYSVTLSILVPVILMLVDLTIYLKKLKDY